MKVLLVDNHRIVSDGLKALLEQQSDIDVIGQAEDGRAAVRMARELRPDVVVMDVAMPELNGLEATRQIRSECPEVRVIALSKHADKRFVTGMILAGAAGYVLKECAFEELARALRLVDEGRVYLSPQIAGVVVDDYVRRMTRGAVPQDPLLAPREKEVLQLLAEGRSTREVASKLHISVKTVATHRRNLMEKLGIRSLAELTKYAIAEGITSLEPGNHGTHK